MKPERQAETNLQEEKEELWIKYLNGDDLAIVKRKLTKHHDILRNVQRSTLVWDKEDVIELSDWEAIIISGNVCAFESFLGPVQVDGNQEEKKVEEGDEEIFDKWELSSFYNTNGGILHFAVLSDSLEMLNYCLHISSDLSPIVDSQGRTPLHLAAEMDNMESVMLIMEAQGNLRYEQDINNRTVIDIAKKKNNTELLAYLIFDSNETVDASKNIVENNLEITHGINMEFDPLIVYAMEYVEELLNKPYIYSEISEAMDGEKIQRPNHNLVHTTRVYCYLHCVIEYYRSFSNKDTLKQYCHDLIGGDKPTEWLLLQIAILFSITGREGEENFLTDEKRYLSYKESSASNFKSFVLAACSRGFIDCSEDEIEEFAAVVYFMGLDWHKGDFSTEHKKHLTQENDGSISGAAPNVIEGKRLLELAHNLDLCRCFAKDKFLSVISLHEVDIKESVGQKAALLSLEKLSVKLNTQTGNSLASHIVGSSIESVGAGNILRRYRYPFKQYSHSLINCLSFIQSLNLASFESEGENTTDNLYDLNQAFIFKSITVNEHNHWGNINVPMLTKSQVTHDSPAANPRLREDKVRKRYSLRLESGEYHIIDKDNKTPLFPQELKKFHSKHTSTSFACPSRGYSPEVENRLFFRNTGNKVNNSVGIRVSDDDVLINRILQGARGTYYRQFYESNDLVQIKKYKNEHFYLSFEDLMGHWKVDPSQEHEVMARIRWLCDGSSQICIFYDELEARMLAQVRALDLLRRLKEQYIENDDIFPENYEVPISFYMPNNRLNLSYYDKDSQERDSSRALNDKLTRSYALYIKLEQASYQNFENLQIRPYDLTQIIRKVRSKVSYNSALLLDESFQKMFEMALINFNLKIADVLSVVVDPMSSLFEAIKNRSITSSMLGAFILQGSVAELNVTYKGSSLLHCAIEYRRHDLVRILLEKGYYITVQDKDGFAAIRKALEMDDWDCINIFTEVDGCEDNDEGSAQFSYPLCAAIEDRNYDMVKALLIKVKTLQNIKVGGKPLLHYAVEEQDHDLVRILLEKGCDITVQNEDGFTAIRVALKMEDWDCIKIFTEVDGCEDNDEGSAQFSYPLCAAIENRDYGMVKALLIKVKTLRNIKVGGKPLLHYAVEERDYELVHILLEKDRGLITVQNEDGFTAIRVGLKMEDWDCIKIFTEVDGCEDNDEGSAQFSSPLRIAVKKDNLDMAKDLLDSKARLDFFNTQTGLSAIHHAVINNNKEMTQMLLDYGADLNLAYKGNSTTPVVTPLYAGIEAEEMSDEMLDFLLEKGAFAEDQYPVLALTIISKQYWILDKILGHSANGAAAALRFSVLTDDLKAVQIILKYRSKIGSDGLSVALCMALAPDIYNHEIVNDLFNQRGINLYYRKSGVGLLDLLVECLLTLTREVNAEEESKDDLSLEAVESRIEQLYLTIIHLLKLKVSLKPSSQDKLFLDEGFIQCLFAESPSDVISILKNLFSTEGANRYCHHKIVRAEGVLGWVINKELATINTVFLNSFLRMIVYHPGECEGILDLDIDFSTYIVIAKTADLSLLQELSQLGIFSSYRNVLSGMEDGINTNTNIVAHHLLPRDNRSYNKCLASKFSDTLIALLNNYVETTRDWLLFHNKPKRQYSIEVSAFLKDHGQIADSYKPEELVIILLAYMRKNTSSLDVNDTITNRIYHAAYNHDDEVKFVSIVLLLDNFSKIETIDNLDFLNSQKHNTPTSNPSIFSSSGVCGSPCSDEDEEKEFKTGEDGRPVDECGEHAPQGGKDVQSGFSPT